jgi:ABC-2 type transport system permease protein
MPVAPAAVVIAGKDLRRGLKSRSLLLTAVVGPLVLGLIMSLAFGDGGGPDATIAVVDLDRTEASRAVVDGLAADLGDGPVTVVTDEDDGPGAVLDERVDAAVVIPAGYTESLTGEPATIEVVRNPDRAIPGEIAAAIAAELATRSDLVRAAASTASAVGAGPAAFEGLDAVSPAITVRVEDLSQRFNAPLYFGPLTIFLFLAMGTAARGLVREDREGTLDRVRSAPVSPTTIVTGSSLGVFVQGLVASFVVYGVSTVLFGADWGEPLEVSAVLVAMVVAVSGLAAVIVALARTEAQAEGWNNAAAFLLGILGGAFFSGARFPGLLGALGAITPNSIAMRALVELGPGGRSLVDVLPLLAALVGMGVVSVVVGGRILRRRYL